MPFAFPFWRWTVAFLITNHCRSHKTLFVFIDTMANLARVVAPGKHYLPSLIFMGKSRRKIWNNGTRRNSTLVSLLDMAGIVLLNLFFFSKIKGFIIYLPDKSSLLAKESSINQVQQKENSNNWQFIE